MENTNDLESHPEGLGGAWSAWQEGREEMCTAQIHFYELNIGKNLQRKQKLGLSF